MKHRTSQTAAQLASRLSETATQAKNIRQIEVPTSPTQRFVLGAILVALFAGLTYQFHIPISIHYLGSYVWVAMLIVLLGVLVGLFTGGKKPDDDKSGLSKPSLVALAVLLVIIATLVSFLSGPVLCSKTYASLMNVQQSEFSQWDDKLLVEGISLMDTESATRVGSRELGSLQDVVSQFDDDEYYQIIVNGTPQKVSPLQYVGFFAWLNNRKTGTPGYVSVDPIRQSADYHELESIDGTGDGMRYVPSGRFNDNLARHVWLRYPTEVLGTTHFELDEEGHPFYVTQAMGFKTPMGGEYVKGVIVTDPTDGSTEYYDAGSVPAWLDVVYDGELLDWMYDCHGAYGGGFLNSIFGQVGCTRTGGDYGYVMIDGEQWIYTGVTSMGNDASNIGFLLSSEKTGESHFLPMASADEESAMSSAEGKVQQFGYEASFPSLVSIDGQPTYVMVLKDSAGLIRLYAMVNAESYNVVACEPDLATCKETYERAMRSAGIEFATDSQEMPEVDATGVETGGGEGVSKAEEYTFEVAQLQLADDAGDTYLYVLSSDGEMYRIRFADDPKTCMGLSTGDKLSCSAVDRGTYRDVVELK